MYIDWFLEYVVLWMSLKIESNGFGVSSEVYVDYLTNIYNKIEIPEIWILVIDLGWEHLTEDIREFPSKGKS